jgi:alpha-tubulin suppressor-like RCC1 family protein
MLIFSGLYTHKKCIDRFSIGYDSPYNLDSILTSFDSIIETVNKKVFYFDNEMKKFVEKSGLNGMNLSTNTDFIWFLNNGCTELIKFGNKMKIINKIDLDLTNVYNPDVDGSIFICATDINVYLFSQKTFKCVYQLESSIENKNINECSKMAIPLNKKFGGDNFRIKKVSCGKEHVLILTEPFGLVYSFGIGTRGQLGHGSIESCYEPVLIDGFSSVKDIECGGWHSTLIDENRQAWSWGWNLNGQLGIITQDEADETIVSIPSLVEVSNIKFLKVSHGSRHSLFLDFDKNLYCCGYNKYNQQFTLNESHFKPFLIEEFKNSVLDIKAGPWFSLILTQK